MGCYHEQARGLAIPIMFCPRRIRRVPRGIGMALEIVLHRCPDITSHVRTGSQPEIEFRHTRLISAIAIRGPTRGKGMQKIVYISSTYGDLKEYRKAVYDALHKMQY